MFVKLLSGVALAATVVLPQAASAGHCGCPCGASYGPAATVVVPQQAMVPGPATTVVPSGPATAVVPPGPADAAGPPVASGEGQTIRRFSYEPGADAAPAVASPAPVYDADFGNVRPEGPTYRSTQPIRQGRSAAGLTGEARLRPGRGR